MSGFRTAPVRVVAPATSANLGPGFDALGLALSMYDEFEGEVTPGRLTVEVAGEASGDVPLDESHLVVRAMRATFDAMGGQPPGLRLRCANTIPHGRGLGSSAAAIVGGVVLARALCEDSELLDDAAALRLASSLEGHPDNVAAALLGGLTVGWIEDGEVFATREDAWAYPVAYVPPQPVATSLARGLLPPQVPHGDAASNAGRAALLVTALTGDPSLLYAGTRDRIHQAYRAEAMPESYALVQRMRAERLPAIVSGAGPTVLAFAESKAGQESLAPWCPDGWRCEILGVDNAGTRVVS